MRHFLAPALALFPFFAALTPAAPAQAPTPDSPAIEARAGEMLSRLTLQQKVDLIGGVDGMFIREIPSIGFPRLKMSDGPEGVRTWGPSTAHAAGIALAATWDPELAARTGSSIADDARARGVHFLLAPGVNIYRAPMNGRNFEYFGEDPFLAARIAVAYIEGVQSRGVCATVKHFAANNSEYDRHALDAVVDERTLREIYLPAFEAAVKEAHVGAVMDSYNLVNGLHSTQNPILDRQILKSEWGFDGILMSDWRATYNGIAAALAGLDLEMPSGEFMSPAILLPAIRAGTVPVAVIDDKVRRIFRTALRFGFLDRPQADSGLPLYSQEGRRQALQEARESLVLLKNDRGLLPLDRGRIRTLAVIGPDAWPAVPGGGGSSNVQAFRPVSFLTGLSDYLDGRVRVLYARGLPTTDEFFRETLFDHSGDQPALRVETFDNPDFAGVPSTVRFQAHADQWPREGWMPPDPNPRSVRWSGTFTPRKSGPHLFLAEAGGRDRYTLFLDGHPIVDQPLREGQSARSVEIALVAGRTVAVRLDYRPYSALQHMGFGVRPLDELVSPEARAVAARADVALVAVGFDPSTEGEGGDRTYALPWGQDELVETVATANRATVVAVTSGGGIDFHRWLPRVAALLQAWYPGQEGGTALAEILFGDRAPEGKLPVSFEASWGENPVHDHYYPEAESGAGAHRVRYAEGVFVGYRYYTSRRHPALFPFGFGLSYTTFAFSHLAAPNSAAASEVAVSFDVTNTGKRAGAEVAQLYVGDPSARIDRPVKELKAFQKVRLQPGETRRVTLRLDRRSFAYYDVGTHGWRVDPGRFVLFVGDSSAQAALTADVTIHP